MRNTFELEPVLVQLTQSDREAVEALYNHYYSRLYNFSRHFLKAEDGIDDIIQEVFVRIWQNRTKIHNPATFNSYIFIITRNLLLNELRSRLSDQKMRDKIRRKSLAVEYTFLEQAEYNDLKAKVDLAINELPERQREIFNLSRIQGLSHHEIAEKLTITSKTVEYHLAKATVMLKKKLQNFDLVTSLMIALMLLN